MRKKKLECFIPLQSIVFIFFLYTSQQSQQLIKTIAQKCLPPLVMHSCQSCVISLLPLHDYPCIAWLTPCLLIQYCNMYYIPQRSSLVLFNTFSVNYSLFSKLGQPSVYIVWVCRTLYWTFAGLYRGVSFAYSLGYFFLVLWVDFCLNIIYQYHSFSLLIEFIILSFVDCLDYIIIIVF